MNWLAYDVLLVLIGFAAIATILWERYQQSRPTEYVRILPGRNWTVTTVEGER